MKLIFTCKYPISLTFSTSVSSILDSGLLAVPKDWRIWPYTSNDSRVYLASSIKDAEFWGYQGLYSCGLRYSDIKIVVLKIATYKLESGLFESESHGEYTYKGDISPEAITVV